MLHTNKDKNITDFTQKKNKNMGNYNSTREERKEALGGSRRSQRILEM
jgi:hypothetical protein